MAIYGTLPSGKRMTIEEWESLTPAQQAAYLRPQSNFKGKKHTAESNEKNAAARRGKKQTSETIARRMAVHIGAKRSEETKAKMRAARAKQVIGPVSDETRMKISIAGKGKKRSPETRARMRAAQARRREERLQAKLQGVSK